MATGHEVSKDFKGELKQPLNCNLWENYWIAYT